MVRADQLEAFLSFLEYKANVLELSAAHNGSYDDGGAENLRNQVEVYRSAITERMPTVLE